MSDEIRARLGKALPFGVYVSMYGHDHVRIHGMLSVSDAAALADRLERADAALAVCDKWIAIAVDIDNHTQDNVLARIALPIVRQIRYALGGTDA